MKGELLGEQALTAKVQQANPDAESIRARKCLDRRDPVERRVRPEQSAQAVCGIRKRDRTGGGQQVIDLGPRQRLRSIGPQQLEPCGDRSGKVRSVEAREASAGERRGRAEGEHLGRRARFEALAAEHEH
jgi:hypothetical protein